ncbi:MAG: trigger factor, partial [Planctomycetes bacterium]|nr:trigger factor [Planctomycetota bacterium]
MNVTIEDAGPCKKVLKFEIPKETIESEFEKKTLEVCGTVELPGFRKGFAPRKLVEKRFGTQIKDEVKQSIVNDSYQKALEEHKISPVGDPKFGDVKMESGQPLNFDVTLEVWPLFDVDNYKSLNLIRKPAAVTDEDVGSALQRLSLQKAQMTVVKDGAVKEGNQVICDYKVEVENACVLDDEDVEVIVENDAVVAHTTISDLVVRMVGVKSGDVCTIDAQLSNNFPKAEYRGKPAKLKLTIKEIKQLTPPPINEDFAKMIGFDSLEDLKKNVRKQVEVDKKNWSEEILKNQLLDTLLEQVKFELPQDLVNYHTEQRVYKHQMDLYKRGVPLEELQKQNETIKNASADSVMRELKASLILDKVAEKEKIFVTENEVEQRIIEIARAYNTDTARVRKQLERQGSLSYLRNEMRESKVISLLLKEAKIADE